MAIGQITNTESGSSVREKLNLAIIEANKVVDKVDKTELSGGQTDQVLKKASDADYDFTWVDEVGGIANIIANKGVGISYDKPVTGLTAGDIYVSTDSKLKFTATGVTTWGVGVALVEGAFINDTSVAVNLLYQYDGTAVELTGSGITDIIQDTTPQLGGFLDTNSKSIHESVGIAIVAANNIAPTRTGNTFVVSGSTQINLINIAALWVAGNLIRLQFTGTPIIKHNFTVSGTNKPIFLKKAADYTAVVNDVLVLLYDGIVWREINDLTKVASGGAGGHAYQLNGVSVTPRTKRNVQNNGTVASLVDDAGSDATLDKQYFRNALDVDPTGLADGNLFRWDAATSKFIPQTTAFFTDIIRDPAANISANGILSTFLKAGYKIDSIVIANQTANAAGNLSVGISALGTQIINAVTVGASATVDCTLVEDFFSTVNDTDLYISSSAWGAGVVTIYFTFKRII